MDNLSIFEVLYPTFKIKKPIRLIELFAGYGSQALALEYLGIPFEHWKICEWNYKSFEAYKKLHTNDDTDYSKEKSKEDLIEYLYSKGISSDWNKAMTKEQIKRLPENKLRAIYNNIQATHNLVNVSQAHGNDFEIEKGYTYILTYSFPCQDLSLAGKRKGMSDTSTRSGLLWEVERILKEMEIKPDVLLMENVPQVHGADNMPHFRKWIQELEKMGYQNYWQDMIATDYGIPQIRNRTFMVSIKGDYNYTFPKPQPLKHKLKDLLEENVDEKYFISDRGVTYITNEKRLKIGHTNINPDAAITLMAMGSANWNGSFISEQPVVVRNKAQEIVKKTDVALTLMSRDYKGFANQESTAIATTLQTSPKEGVIVKGNYSPSNHNAARIVDDNGVAPTVMENHGTVTAIEVTTDENL